MNVSNKVLLQEIELCQVVNDNLPTDELVAIWIQIVNVIAHATRFRNNGCIEDMKSEAITYLCKSGLRFDITKSSNPYAYYMQAIHASFIQTLNKEKKQQQIREDLMRSNNEI